jgi:hypothetical protein
MANKSWHLIFVVFPVLILAGCRPAPPAAPLMDVTIVSADVLPEGPDDAIWNRVPEHIDGSVASGSSRTAADAGLDPRGPSAGRRGGRSRRLPARVGRSHAGRPTGPRGFPGRLCRPVAGGCGTDAARPADGRTGPAGRDHVLDRRLAGDCRWPRYDAARPVPHATIDHYPHEAAPLKSDPGAQREVQLRYSPAHALGNFMAGPRERPVQDLIAEGPGTLGPGPSADSQGRGQHNGSGWSVVLSRRLPAGWDSARGSQVAFAVWQGDRNEVGARKMRTGWINLVQKP